MAVRVGKIDLVGLSRVSTEDTRSLVKQRGPGQSGGLYQDLGREPVTIVMEGILLGEDTQAALEELRTAQAKAKPMTFAADAIAGADLTHVLIADFQVRQLAGHASRFSFFLRVQEYTEPPEGAEDGAAKVDSAAKEEAKTWQENAVDAAAVKQNPETLAQAVEKNPDVVTQLDGNQLANATDKSLDKMSSDSAANLVGTVAQKNPSAFTQMIDKLKAKGRLGDLISKLAGMGSKLLVFLKSIKLGSILKLLKALAGGADFLQKLKNVIAKGKALVEKIGNFDLNAQLEAINQEWNKPKKEGVLDLYSTAMQYTVPGNSAVFVWEDGVKLPIDYGQPPKPATPADSPKANQVAGILNAVADLVKAIDELMNTDTFKGIVDFVKDLQLEKVIAPLLSMICTLLQKIIGWVGTVGRIVALPRLLEPFMMYLEEIELMTDMDPPGRKEELEQWGTDELVPIAEGANVVISQFTRLHGLASELAGKGQVEKALENLETNLKGMHKTFDNYRVMFGGTLEDEKVNVSAALPAQTAGAH
ncbi:MAG TPA: hypothetical protein PK156_19935 [Polyangium sp.]|nr:hypothetical protein [Polyangium sp.]